MRSMSIHDVARDFSATVETIIRNGESILLDDGERARIAMIPVENLEQLSEILACMVSACVEDKKDDELITLSVEP